MELMLTSTFYWDFEERFFKFNNINLAPKFY